MMYELRIYHCAPGRLPALHARFKDTTLALWARYGIEQAGFFTTLVGTSNQSLTYLLKWDSLAERERKWNAFIQDPEWITKRALSEADGIIVERIENSFLEATSYSAMQ
ncbi:MAG: hypothetical protein ACI83P_000830 [Janthinobacterium sp.]|jgi:hypothetical protein